MTQPLTPRRASRPVTKFNPLVLVAGLAILGLLILGALLLHTAWQRTPSAVAKETPQEQHLKLPDVIARPLPPREPSIIVRTPTPPPPSEVAPQPSLDVPRIQQQSLLDTINPFPKTAPSTTPPAKPENAAPTPPITVPPTPPVAQQARKGWDVLARGKQGGTETTKPRSTGAELLDVDATARELLQRQGQPRGVDGAKNKSDAQDLIHAARWAIPANPLKTIYRSQTLTGRLLQAVNSDIPGQVKVQLTTPLLDRFGYDTTILPRDTLVIASQEGRPQYGTARLGLKLEQLELPSGEVIALQAMVGDEAGTNGLAGKANNHMGKVILATGLSALLNIGARTAAGTPGPGQYFQNPLQQGVADLSQSVQRDAQSVIDRELRIPPTITIPAGTFCTISLLENIQLNRPPLVAR
jgi:type IV secretion system protein TrbI